MDAQLVRVNESLVNRVKTLEAQVSLQDKKLEMCLSLIDAMGHMLPNAFKSFKESFDSLEDFNG